MENNKESKTVEFEYKIGDIVILRPVDGDKDSLELLGNPGIYPKYRVMSRVYEELLIGQGIVCYAVRHVQADNVGGGKIFKFQEEELISLSSFMALQKLVSKNTPQPQQYAQSITKNSVPMYRLTTSNQAADVPF